MPEREAACPPGDARAGAEGIAGIDLDVDLDRLRADVLRSLREQGFEVGDDGVARPAIDGSKEALRALHRCAVEHQRERSLPGLARHEPWLLEQLARGRDIEPTAIRPELRVIKGGTREELLFRWVRLHWSVPTSAGYGRRLRFLVWDRGHDKLIGIIGLCDPVFSLGVRDRWIGWTKEVRKHRIGAVMEAFVLGAVPPYRELLCGKLVAMLAASNEVRRAFHERYGSGSTYIAGAARDGRLALIMTSSALGRSSVYNRIKYGGRLLYQPLGYTKGYGEFHFHNSVYDRMLRVAKATSKPTAKHSSWGNGWRSRREVLRKALPVIGLSRDLVWHGVERQVFAVPLAANSKEFLRGEAEELLGFDLPAKALAEAHRERWLLPRASRDDKWRRVDPETWRLCGSWAGRAGGGS